MLGAVSASFALLLGGCSGADEEEVFTYGKAEMEGAVVGTWHGTWLPPDAEPSPLTLVIDTKNDPSARRTACGNQTFSSAPAPGLRPSCVSMSSLAVTGLLSTGDASAPHELSGSYLVSGLNFDPGELYLYSADDTLRLTANQGETLAWERCSVHVDRSEVPCTLDTRE